MYLQMTVGDNCDKGYLEIKERLDGINGDSSQAMAVDRLVHEFNILAFYTIADHFHWGSGGDPVIDKTQ